MSYRGCLGLGPLCLIVGVLAVWQWETVEVHAVTVYSYIDEHGNPVFTDAPETIPEKYRAKVKTHEQPNAPQKSPSTAATVGEKVKEQMKGFGITMPSSWPSLKKLGSSQSDILNYAGAMAVVLLLIMYFSKESPMLRLLAFGLLIVLGIGAPLLMYVSDGGPMDTMKKKAVVSGQAQQDRLQQAPQ